MKRPRKSKKKREESDEEILITGTSIRDLNNDLLIDIFSRLSVKSIFKCRSVCKLWLSLLLNPNFAKLHFSRSPVCPLLRDSGKERLAKALYLVEFERDSVCDVTDKSCDVGICCSPVCDRHVNVKLNTIFMLPDRMMSSSKVRERRFDVVNSCNGFLCLRGSLDSYPIIIYNPVTGEYSVLPVPDEPYKDTDPFAARETRANVGGLGYCSKTNRYKVLVMITERVVNPTRRESDRRKTALIYTIGLGGVWRRIGNAPCFDCELMRPAFLNNALHWYAGLSEIIISFDFEGEQFHALPSYNYSFNGTEIDKRLKYDDINTGYFEMDWFETDRRMSVLRGCLSLCHGATVLIMKQYGVDESWDEKYSGISKRRWPDGAYQPIDFLSNGDLLMYYEGNAFVSYDGDKFKYFKFCQTFSRFEVIAHVPSFASLNEIVGNDMKVVNVKSSEPRKIRAERLVLTEEDHRDMYMSDTDYSNGSDCQD